MIILDRKNRNGDTVLDDMTKEEGTSTDSSDIFGNDEILTSDDVFGTNDSTDNNKNDF